MSNLITTVQRLSDQDPAPKDLSYPVEASRISANSYIYCRQFS